MKKSFCILLLQFGVLQYAIARGPLDNKESLMNWARVAEREGHYDKAEDFLRRASELFPEDLAPVAARLEMNEKRVTTDVWLSQVNEALMAFPYDALLYVFQSRAFRQLGKLEDAQKSWLNASRLAPQGALVAAEKSFLLSAGNESLEALRMAQKSLRLRETSSGLRAQVLALASLGQHEALRAPTERLLDRSESGDLAWLARNLSQPGNEILQEKVLKAWIANKPFLSEAHLLYAENLARRGRPALALDHFRQARLLDPSSLRAMRAQVDFMLAQGQTSEARVSLLEFQEMNPGHEDSRRLYLGFLKKQNDLESLGKESLRLRHDYPKAPWVHAYLRYVDIRLHRPTSEADPSLLSPPARRSLEVLALVETEGPEKAQQALEEAHQQGILSAEVFRQNRELLTRPSVPSEPPVEWTVASDQTLYRIARQALGNGERWSEIWQANADRIQDPKRLRVGVRLRLPSRSGRQPAEQGSPDLSLWTWQEDAP